MKSDLRKLITAEEAYFADHVKYTSNLGAGFAVTHGNSMPHITLVGDGWTATNANPNTRQGCAIFVGSTPIPPATREGTPACG